MNDPLDRLRAANPIPTSLTDAADRHSSIDKEVLFEEILAMPEQPTIIGQPAAERPARDFGAPPTHEEVTNASGPKRSRRWIPGVAAAAAVGVIGLGAVSLIPQTTTPAGAAMIQAAEQTESMESGIVTVGFSVAEGDGMEGSADSGIVLTSQFDGDDFSARLVESSGDASSEQLVGLEVRLVDGTLFGSDGERWFEVSDPIIETLLTTNGLPVDVRDSMAAAVVDLAKVAEGVEEVEPGHFTGIITGEETASVVSKYPSLNFFATELTGVDVEGEEIEFDLVLDETGAIDTVTLRDQDVEDPTSSEPTLNAIEIVVDFDDLGEPQAIEAPDGAIELDVGEFLD